MCPAAPVVAAAALADEVPLLAREVVPDAADVPDVMLIVPEAELAPEDAVAVAEPEYVAPLVHPAAEGSVMP